MGASFQSERSDNLLLLAFIIGVVLMPVIMTPLGGNYPDLLQRFAIFGIFAIGFNILFGLTGYLSFGHAAFLGVGSYSAVWMFKLLSMNIIPAIIFSMIVAGIFAALIGYVSLRRSGIYFSILTLAFAEMSYKLAYSVLTPITNGETGLQLNLDDPRILDGVNDTGSLPVTSLFGLKMGDSLISTTFMGQPFVITFGFIVCAVLLIVAFWVALRITRSPFGLMLKAIRSNQARMSYTGFNTRPYTLAAFVISGMYAGLAGGLMAAMDPLAGAERMQWTASGEVVLMTILGGTGTLIGPVLGAGMIKYFENIFSSFNEASLHAAFAFLPDGPENILIAIVHPFVGEGWHLTLGVIFMFIVIFLPGGLMEGVRRTMALVNGKGGKTDAVDTGKARPAEQE